MPRKRTFLDNFSIEENRKSDNIKKKKCSINDLQSTKTEAEKPITRLKTIKNTKSQISASEISTNNTSQTSIDNNDISDSTLAVSNFESNVSKTPMESSLKSPKNKVISISNKPVINNVCNDVIGISLEKNDNTVSSKSIKLKTSKSSPIKVKFTLNNVNNKKKSIELKTSNDLETLKNLKRKCIKSVTSVQNKSTENSVSKDESMIEKIKNLVTSKTPENKTSKSISPSKKKSVSFNESKDDGPSDVLEVSNDFVTEKISKNQKSKSVSPVKKKYGLNSINKNGTSNELEENCQSKVTRNRSRPILNKLQSKNSNEILINNCVVKLDDVTNGVVILEKYEPQDPAEFDDNTMMLRSNKPPKIKKKWSDKWSGNKSSNSMLKLNVGENSSTSKTEVNNCDNTIRKPLKIQKPKCSNCKKVETKMIEKLNINNSISVNISSTYDAVKNSTTNFSETSNNILKLNADDHISTSKIEVNNCDNTIKKQLKIHKPKSSNCKKLKTKMIEKLNVNNSLSNINNTCDINDIKCDENSTINFLETQNCDAELITNSSSKVPSVLENDDIVVPPESNGIKPQPVIIPSVTKNDGIVVPFESNGIKPLPVIVQSVSENHGIIVPSESNGIELQSSSCTNLLHFATLPTTLTSLPTSTSLPSTSTILPTTSSILPSASSILPSTSSILPSTSTVLPSTSTVLPSTSTVLPSTSTVLPSTFTEMPNIVSGNENNSQSPLVIFEPIINGDYLPVPESEISYGMSILSEAISRQCNESMNSGTQTMSVEQDPNEIKSPPKEINSSTSQFKVQSPTNKNKKSRKIVKHFSENHKQPIKSNSQSRIEQEVSLLSKCFDVPIDTLKRKVIEEPLSVFKKKYSALACPSMVTVAPVTSYIEKSSRDHITGSQDIQYKIAPIRESAAYEKTNLIDLMAELSKTMPSWSLSIVPDPSRYVISHMSINEYGVPLANKSVVLDKFFRASIYINHCLQQEYCKRYTTATEIVNLIKDLHSL